MLEFIHKNLNHFMFLFLLISRLGDIISTLVATPSLKLEANLLAKKFGRPFIFLSLLICFIAYYNVRFSLAVLIPSLFVSASNISKIWILKALGEDSYINLVSKFLKKNGLRHLLVLHFLSCFFIILAGLIIFILYPDQKEWGFWVAYGIFLYGMVVLFWGTISTVNLYFKAKRIDN